MTLTHIRYNDPRRRAKRSKLTTEDIKHGSLTDSEEEGFEDDNKERHSMTRTWYALVTSPVIGYAASYEFLHFTFDLHMWSDIGAKRNIGSQYEVPMRILIKNHPFSPLYWKAAHCGLIDMVRQVGYPQLFGTA